MEPDHCSTLGAVLRTHPKAQVVASAKAISMIGQFFDAVCKVNLPQFPRFVKG